MKRETREIWTPVWRGSHLGKVGYSAPHTPPCSAAHTPPVHLSLHLPACGGTHCIHLTVSGPRNTSVTPGRVTGKVFPNLPASPHAQGRLLLLTPLPGGRGAAALMKILMMATGLYYKHLSLIWIQATLSSFGSIKGPESGFQSHVHLLLDSSAVPAWCKGASVSQRIRPCIFYTLL